MHRNLNSVIPKKVTIKSTLLNFIDYRFIGLIPFINCNERQNLNTSQTRE